MLGEVESVAAAGVLWRKLSWNCLQHLSKLSSSPFCSAQASGALSILITAIKRRSYGRAQTRQCAVPKEMKVATIFWQHRIRVRAPQTTWSLRIICAGCCRCGDFDCYQLQYHMNGQIRG